MGRSICGATEPNRRSALPFFVVQSCRPSSTAQNLRKLAKTHSKNVYPPGCRPFCWRGREAVQPCVLEGLRRMAQVAPMSSSRARICNIALFGMPSRTKLTTRDGP